MNVTFTYRHTDSSDALEARMRGHLDKLAKSLSAATDIHCVFTVEGYRNTVEINIVGGPLELSAHDAKDDMYKAIDSAAAKLERQVRKQREKSLSHS